MQAIARLFFSIYIVLPVLSSADTSCFEQAIVIKNLASLRANWNSFGRAKIKTSWEVNFEDVFCSEQLSTGGCTGLSFTTLDENCGCGITFYFDDNDKVQHVNVVYTVSGWSTALHAARDFVMSMKPLSAAAGYLSIDEGWNISVPDRKYVRNFSWSGEQISQKDGTLVIQESRSVQLTISECSSDKWRIDLYILRPKEDGP